MRTWLFDVDGCLIDSLSGTSLRPGAAELLAELRADGHPVALWSAGGADYARQRAIELGIDGLVDAFYAKDGRDAAGRYLTAHVIDDLADVIFVDDRPEDIPVGATIIAVSPYLANDRHDRALATVAMHAERLSSS